ncbi:MAG TPA: CDP-alcohol phosphatidyltransferase family protein [Burkholderiales bacterium]|nr:CDP-alcohol phosphatidyltransferase family protein [Burkholderiales bacterium]
MSNLNLPNALSLLRIALAPVLVALAWRDAHAAFAACFALCLLTDIADGQIARRFNLTTELGARLDSWGDVLTYLAVLPGLFWLHPQFVSDARVALGAVVASYLIPIGAGFIKYRQLTSYHTRLATVAAYALGASLLIIFAGGPPLAFYLAALIIFASQVEELAITAVLPGWQANVPSLRHALRMRGP